MADALLEAVRANGSGPVDRATIRAHIDRHYPDRWEPATLTAHLYACTVNNPKAYLHHPSARRYLYRHPDDTFELYDEARHGPNVWAPPDADSLEGEPDGNTEHLIEASITLERDLEAHIVRNLGVLEDGLSFVARQVVTGVGRVDVLARDRDGRTVVIELKVGEAGDASIGQIARYLGWYSREGPVRGYLVAADFPERVRFAATAIPNLSLRKFQVRFQFEPVTL